MCSTTIRIRICINIIKSISKSNVTMPTTAPATAHGRGTTTAAADAGPDAKRAKVDPNDATEVVEGEGEEDGIDEEDILEDLVTYHDALTRDVYAATEQRLRA